MVEELKRRRGGRRAARTPAHDYLAREILKEAGDAVVLEPEEARAAVLDAAEALAGRSSASARRLARRAG